MGCFASSPTSDDDSQPKDNSKNNGEVHAIQGMGVTGSADKGTNGTAGKGSAATTADGDKGDGDGGPGPSALIRNQRRRLSVAPQHVGEIDAEEKRKQDDIENTKRRLSVVEGTLPSQSGVADLPELDGVGEDEIGTTGGDTLFECIAKTKKGYVPYNHRKKNQDAYVVKDSLGGQSKLALYGAFDGHGEFGEFVSNFVKDNIGHFLELEEQNDGRLHKQPVEALLSATRNMCSSLKTTSINCQFSGTTAVFTVRVGDVLYTANVGDSRCVLARLSANGQLEAVPLSFDHKPDNVDEKARILKAGGRVAPLPGPPDEDCGPPRVWLAEVDVPGLAMSRSVGDYVSHTVGVLDVPEITSHRIEREDQFVVWASDGVWEFLSNQQVIDILNSHKPNWEAAVNALIEAATKEWRREEEVIDDITAVCEEMRQRERNDATCSK